MASRNDYRNLSLRLSRVMDDIGVNEETVMGWRRIHLIQEALATLRSHLLQENETIYFFGSQTEGTTTCGLESDRDCLVAVEHFSLIQDLNDWVPDMNNLLMVHNERFPGYCQLQLLWPCAEDVLQSYGYMFDEAGRVLHNYIYEDGVERHGPAESLRLVDGRQGDYVCAIHCKTWPNGYKMWSTHPKKGNWPTPEMISYMEKSGCFVVPVAHRLDEQQFESWRISTSLPERCLMFSLNITQIRCYTIIKMIVKTFIDPVVPDVISSYICKNLLFHCAENTMPDFWKESNLLRCVNQVLLILLETIRCMNCPNYFNESINLLLGKVNKDNQVVLMGVIWKVLISEGLFLSEIRFDNINELMHNYDKHVYQGKDSNRDEKCKDNRAHPRDIILFVYLGYAIRNLMLRGIFSRIDFMSLQNILLLFSIQGPLQYVSATLLIPFLCSHLATLKANGHILHGKMLSNRTSLLYERSLDSDMTSSRLKFASYLHCTGQFKKVMSALLEVKHRGVVDGSFGVCVCDRRKGICFSRINMDPSQPIQCLSPSNVSLCVMFSQAERRCCPRELQYEMYRSTEQEKLQRDKYGNDYWMDLACIDPSSYLDFLCYMTCRHLGLRELQVRAHKRLKERASEDEHHRDTKYNLLGQCYEFENRFDEAFACYCKSLREKPTHNAARWHIALLFYKVYQN